MRKVLSLLVALVLVFSLATAVSAATEDKHAELIYDLQWNSDWECYALKCYLKLDGGLVLTKTGPRYTGSGLYSFKVTFNGITPDDFMYPDAMSERGEGFVFGAETVADGFYTFGGQCAGTVQDMHKVTSDGPVELFTLFVAGDDKAAILEKFSDLGYTAFKVGSVTSTSGGTVVVNDMITTYAVGDDGVNKHVDADYVVVTPEAGGNDVATVETETAVLTGVKEAMIEKGQAVAMEFTAAALKDFTGMNWELIFENGDKKYAVVDYPAETITNTADDATVKFVAAFLVYDRGDAEVNAIETVSAGFCDETKELVAQTAAVEVTTVPTPAE